MWISSVLIPFKPFIYIASSYTSVDDFFYNKLSRSIGSIWNKDMLYFELLFKIHLDALILGNLYKLDKKYINIYEIFTFVENNSFKLSKYTFACLFVSNQRLLNWLGQIFCGKHTWSTPGKVYNWSIFKNVTRKKSAKIVFEK